MSCRANIDYASAKFSSPTLTYISLSRLLLCNSVCLFLTISSSNFSRLPFSFTGRTLLTRSWTALLRTSVSCIGRFLRGRTSCLLTPPLNQRTPLALHLYFALSTYLGHDPTAAADAEMLRGKILARVAVLAGMYCQSCRTEDGTGLL